jgi:hypothetical protein
MPESEAAQSVIDAAHRAVVSWMFEPGSTHVDRMIELRTAVDHWRALNGDGPRPASEY